MTQIHDGGYRNFFLNPVAVRQLLTSFVHENWVHQIDFDTLERMETTFVTDDFSRVEADLIYKVKLNGRDAYIYLLIEFQSTVDRFMALRMLRYITEFYQHLHKTQHPKMLPSVFPLLLYNGNRKWTAPEEISTLIDKDIPSHYIPAFRYYKLAENEVSKDTLRNIQNLVAALFYAENSTPHELEEEIDTVVEMLKNEHPEEVKLFVNWLQKVFGHKTDDVPDEILDLQELHTMLATKMKEYEKKLIQQGIQQGVKQGMQKGIQQGSLSAKREMARVMKQKGIDISTINEVTGLTEEEISWI